ncbi:MAG TPA: SRPBCC domain-containing protein [Candidatus Limnocylindrales bacterium]
MSQLRIEFEVAHAPLLVWRALTEAKPLNEWFQPVAGWPESSAMPGALGRVHPTDDLPGFGEFDVDLVEAEPPRRLVFRWRGDDFTSEVTFQIRPAAGGGGSAVTIRQTGFLGSQEAHRREALARAHQRMVERLRAVLDRLALGVGESSFLVAEPPEPRLKDRHRARIIGIVGAVIVAALCGTAGAVWLNQGGERPPANAAGEEPEPGLGIGTQPPPPTPEIGASPSKKPAPVGTQKNQEPNAPSSPPGFSQAVPAEKPLTATYRTVALVLVGVTGFDTEVTVKNPGGTARNGWTVVLTMPDATAVENRSGDTVKLAQEGEIVTLRPVSPTLAGNGTVTFVVRFPALLALGKSVKACTIDGQACAQA